MLDWEEGGDHMSDLISRQQPVARGTNVLSNDTVSRQAAIDAHCELCEDKGLCGDICPDVEVFRLIPSAQPEIIRCKDCKFYTPLNRETKSGICSLLVHQNFGDDWYCAGAERRTDETD